MATIPGWAYAGVGGAIAVYSKFVQAKTESGPMRLFFWIGIILLVVGLFKILITYILGSRRRDRVEKRRDEAFGDRTIPREARDQLICPRCNAKLHPRSRYCNWCGTRQ